MNDETIYLNVFEKMKKKNKKSYSEIERLSNEKIKSYHFIE